MSETVFLRFQTSEITSGERQNLVSLDIIYTISLALNLVFADLGFAAKPQ
ncbi:MAG: hypothetical protein ACKVKR_11755 [Pseudomonadales bacterium]